MAHDFVAWLVEVADSGDEPVLDNLRFRLDEHLVRHGANKAAERQRIATEFSRKAPNTPLINDILAIIQA